MRNAGVGICSAANRLGSLLAPLVTSLLIDAVNGDWLVVILFGISMGLAGTFGMLVKETKGTNIERSVSFI